MSGLQQLLFTDGAQQSQTFEVLSLESTTTNFVVPAGVTSINIMAVGGGGGGSAGGTNADGGCGGGLVWTDDVPVTPGETLIVGVGTGGHGHRRVYQGIDNNGIPQYCAYDDCSGHTSYVKRQSNNQFIVKAYGGGYYGSESGGGHGMFTEGTGVIKSGGDGWRNAGNYGGGWPITNFVQGGDNSYKGQTGGGSKGGASTGRPGVPLVSGQTGGAGGDPTGYTSGSTGGQGGLYGGAGGNGDTSGGQTGFGGNGGHGGVRISWDTPIGDGAPYIDGKYSVQFKGGYYYQYLIVTPPTPDYFQLGDSDWTMEFWWRPYQGAPGQSYWSLGGAGDGAPFIEGLDENNNVTWKIAPAQTNSVGWYHQNQSNKDNNEDAALRWYLGGDYILSHGPDGEGGDWWRHIVFERIGTGLYLFVGGMRRHQYAGNNGDLFQFADMANLNDTSTKRIAIGGHGAGSGQSAAMAGLISNVRVVTGRTVYGLDAWNPNHLEPVKQIPDTKLLACNGTTVDTFYLGQDENTVVGQKEYTVVGTYSWTCPADVTSVCVVCVGGGGGSSGGAGGAGGAGGGLGWKNNISVTPGQSYTVVVGDGGAGVEWSSPGNLTPSGENGGDSYFINTSTVKGGGGQGGPYPVLQGSLGPGVGGDYTGDGGGNGGDGGGAGTGNNGTGGGGAGGYSGNGGNGGNNTGGGAGQDGTGGAGGGGGVPSSGGNGTAAGGGGTGIWGEGTSGTGGLALSNENAGGRGGSPHWMGGMREDPATGARLSGQGRYPPYSQGATLNTGDIAGGTYGGGAGAEGGGSAAYKGASGAVRIIWGAGRSFPSTNTEDLNCAIYGHNVAATPNSYGGAEDPVVHVPDGNNPDKHPYGTYNGGVS
tara:strand:+ start:618 stop:3221 length:2604 start_codon:yes stop_codon:yes gene_type:complete